MQIPAISKSQIVWLQSSIYIRGWNETNDTGNNWRWNSTLNTAFMTCPPSTSLKVAHWAYFQIENCGCLT
jgi:hypothetical protein